MLVEKLSPSSRHILFSAKRKAEKETLGLPTFAHLLSSFSSEKDGYISSILETLDLHIDRTLLYQTAPLEEIIREAVLEARRVLSETVETSHLFFSTLKMLNVSPAILEEVQKRLTSALPEEESKKKKTLIENYTTDLSLGKKTFLIRPEVEDAFKVLLRRHKGSLCLSGEKGVGKTSLVSSMAGILGSDDKQAGKPSLSKLDGAFDNYRDGLVVRTRSDTGGTAARFDRTDFFSTPLDERRRAQGQEGLNLHRRQTVPSNVPAKSDLAWPANLTSRRNKFTAWSGLPWLPARSGKGMKILKFNTNAFLMADLGNPESVFLSLLDEAVKNHDSILFFDDFNIFFTPSLTLHSIIPSIKSCLEMRGLRIIVAYDTSEFSRMFEQDDFFARFFTTLNIEACTPIQTLEILEIERTGFSTFHNVRIPKKLLKETVELSYFVNHLGVLPEKSLDILDLACVEAKFRRRVRASVSGGGKQLPSEGQTSQPLLPAGGFPAAVKGFGRTVTVSAEDVRRVVSNLSGLSLTTLSRRERKSLIGIEKILSAEIIGQEEAIKAVSKAVRKAKLGLNEERKPLGSFLFLGPTGVGKTELARALSRYLFGGDDPAKLIKLDMSEFRERHTVSRLIGAPPGYVGFGQGGELTSKVRENPHSLILIDEMEKASAEVLNLFLQIMDEGRLTDGEGVSVDFRQTIIVFTSNVGAELIRKGRLGFALDRGGAGHGEEANNKGSKGQEEIKDRLLRELKNSFKPEFLNRLDSTIVFRTLRIADVKKIAENQLREVGQRLRKKGVKLSFDRSVLKNLAFLGYSEEYGARFLKRVIEEKIVDVLSSKLLAGQIKEGASVKIGLDRGRLSLKVNPRPTKPGVKRMQPLSV